MDITIVRQVTTTTKYLNVYILEDILRAYDAFFPMNFLFLSRKSSAKK